MAAPGNAPDAKYTVHHDGGATVVAVDQRHQSGEWVKLGSFAFEAGDYRVELSDQAVGLVTADAVYVVPTPTGDPDSYIWTPTIATTADYQVYARWTAEPDRAANAEYVVETPSGLDIVTVSQRQGGGAWNLLGTFELEAGTGNRIVLNAEEADGTVVADAIRIVRAVAAGEIAYVHTDHLGQPQKLTDATATLLWDRVPLPFGASLSEAGLGETSLRFPGQWADAESGLHYNYFRDYDPSLGRYIQSDPIGLAGGLNTYGYVHGNPLRWTDPTGERINPLLVGVAVGLGTVAYKLRCKDLGDLDAGDYGDIALAGLGGWGAAAGIRYAPAAAALLRHLLGGAKSGGGRGEGAGASSSALGGTSPSSSPLGHLLNGSRFEKFLTSKGRALQFLNSGSARAAFDQMRRDLGVSSRQVTTHANGTQTFRAGNQTFSLRSDSWQGPTISVQSDLNVQQIVIRFRQ